jgi:hypothetical protein
MAGGNPCDGMYRTGCVWSNEERLKGGESTGRAPKYFQK